MKKTGLLLIPVLLVLTLQGQPPGGYYDDAAGLAGDTLRHVLHNIIKNHSPQTYASLWNHFGKTDRKPSGEVWDMYSDIPGGTPAYSYSFFTDQCGNYVKEGDCYNREHSVPSSWFNSQDTVYTDLFHIYPTDGFVNGKRGNYPYGEVLSPSWTSANGSKLGNMVFPGYAGIVFEPVNGYKGDLARTYFYMVVRYLDRISSWTSPMFSGDSLTSWSLSMLLKWHNADSVDQKERGRNDSVFAIQGNRNPFIDHPEWVSLIWDTQSGGGGQLPFHPLFAMFSDTELLHVKLNGCERATLLLYSSSGSLVFSASVSGTESFFRPAVAPGIYFAVLASENMLLRQKVPFR